jgi:hypothetical protein
MSLVLTNFHIIVRHRSSVLSTFQRWLTLATHSSPVVAISLGAFASRGIYRVPCAYTRVQAVGRFRDVRIVKEIPRIEQKRYV